MDYRAEYLGKCQKSVKSFFKKFPKGAWAILIDQTLEHRTRREYYISFIFLMSLMRSCIELYGPSPTTFEPKNWKNVSTSKEIFSWVPYDLNYKTVKDWNGFNWIMLKRIYRRVRHNYVFARKNLLARIFFCQNINLPENLLPEKLFSRTRFSERSMHRSIKIGKVCHSAARRDHAEPEST